MEQQKRRKGDTVKAKITTIAAWITSITIIAGIFGWFGSTKWVDRKDANIINKEIKTETRRNREDILTIKGDINLIKERTKDMAVIQRQILREVRK